jgi:uracil-DNA glycosylase family 4
VTSPSVVEALARYLAQRKELGYPALTLESLSGPEAIALARNEPREAWTSTRSADRDRARQAPPVRSSGQDREPEPPVVPSLPESSDLAALRAEVAACTLCSLHRGRTQTVFSDGNPEARLMVVGEAPGANEDRTGLPFVGQAGKLLDLLLASVGLSRLESVYICNVLKCRPPGNRNPEAGEIQSCSPYLKRQIELVRPEVILAVGTFSAQVLTGSNQPLGKLRGSVHSYQGVPTIVTYHPAALLRNSGWTRATWDDLQLMRDVLDGTAS